MKNFLTFVFIFLFSLVLNLSQCFAQETVVLPSASGKVVNVEYVDLSEGDIISVKQVADIKIVEGSGKGALVTVDNMLTGNPYYDINLHKGMKVILHVEKDEDGLIYSVEDISRSNALIWLSLLFCGLLLYVGKKKGGFSFFSIILTCILVFRVLSPMILSGINPIAATVFICLISTAVTMYLVGGFNRKSTAATLGCTLSLIIAGVLSFITAKLAHLTGFSGENSTFLYAAHPELDFISIVVSAMILATLGAVMDVAMSIASTVNEIFTVDNTKTVKELFYSGMNVGRDIIGTMANTLILVYVGGALPLILLASNIDVQKFFNLNQVVTEMASALIGSSAIVICVPITAIIASEMVRCTKKYSDFESLD